MRTAPPASGAAGAAERSYEVYDFRRPTTLAREQSRVLELAFETFTRQWATQLTAKTRVRSLVAFNSVGIRSYDDYAGELPPLTTMMLLDVSASASGAKAVIQFPAAAALGWITRMLGGGNEPIGSDVEWAPPERAFTQIEAALVRRLVDDTIDDLRYSFGNRLTGELSIDSIQFNSQFAQAAAPSDLMIVAEFTVTVADRTDAATVVIPADAVLPGLIGVQPTTPPSQAAALMRAQLSAVPVDVALELTPMRVTASSVIGLAVGDIVPLPHPSHKPLNVAVDGRAIARASVGTTGSRIACVVVDTTEESAR